MKSLVLLPILMTLLMYFGGCGSSPANISFNTNANRANVNATPPGNVNTNANQIPTNRVNANQKPTPAATGTPFATVTPQPESGEKRDEALFSFPPPKVTDYTEVSPDDLKNPAGNTDFNFVAKKLANVLERTGYSDTRYAYFWNEQNEFALVTAMERVNAAGTPLEGYSRWDDSAALPTPDNAEQYLRFLVAGKRVYYRVFAFVVTPKEYGRNLRRNNPPDFQTARNWVERGEARLGSGGPGVIETVPFDDRYRCYSLLYLFVNDTSLDSPLSIDASQGVDLRFREGLEKSIQVHLRNSGISFGG